MSFFSRLVFSLGIVFLSLSLMGIAIKKGPNPGPAYIGSNSITGANGESFFIGVTDGLFDMTKNTGGTVTMTCSDTDDNAPCLYRGGGTSPVSLGHAQNPTATITTDGGSIVFDGTMTAVLDVNVNPSSSTTFFGENAAAQQQFVGLPKLGMSIVAALTNALQAEPLMDDSPAGECAPIGGGAEADDSTNFQTGAASYKMTFDASVGAAEGVDCTVAWENTAAIVSFGFWLRSSVTFASGDLEIVLDDGTSAEATEDITITYATADEWVWIEVDVTSDCAVTCAEIDGIFIQTTAQAPTTFNDAVLNIDSGAIWLTGCEQAIGTGHDVYVDGVMGVLVAADLAASVNTVTALVEWTDYFVNYQAGNDVICALSDQSANYAIVFHADQ